MPFSFYINRPTNVNKALTQVSRLIRDNNGTFSGNEISGCFSGNGVSGNYKISDNVKITITEKPFIYPKSIVEDRIRSYFRSA